MHGPVQKNIYANIIIIYSLINPVYVLVAAAFVGFALAA